MATLENPNERFVRIFSIDPGYYNVGLCVLDSDWRILDLARTTMPCGGAELERMKHRDRSRWFSNLAKEMGAWYNRYVVPRIPLEGGRLLFVVEENGPDLQMTKDWTGILAGMLHSWTDVELRTVAPKSVAKWMYRQGMRKPATRDQKKRYAMEQVGKASMNPNAHVPQILDEHSADAYVNAMYIRQKLNKKRK